MRKGCFQLLPCALLLSACLTLPDAPTLLVDSDSGAGDSGEGSDAPPEFPDLDAAETHTSDASADVEVEAEPDSSTPDGDDASVDSTDGGDGAADSFADAESAACSVAADCDGTSPAPCHRWDCQDAECVEVIDLSQDEAACDDGEACTVGEACSGGSCVGGSPPDDLPGNWNFQLGGAGDELLDGIHSWEDGAVSVLVSSNSDSVSANVSLPPDGGDFSLPMDMEWAVLRVRLSSAGGVNDITTIAAATGSIRCKAGAIWHASGGVTIAGTWSGAGYVGAGAEPYVLPAVDKGIFVARLAADGEPSWVRTATSPGAIDLLEQYAMDATPDGNRVLVGGAFAETLLFSEGSSVSAGVGAKPDLPSGFVALLDGDGAIQWLRSVTPPESAEGLGSAQVVSAALANDQVIITVSAAGYLEFASANGAEQWTSQPNRDLDTLVAALDANGLLSWIRTISGEDEDVALTVEPTKDGGLLTAGWVFGEAYVVGTSGEKTDLAGGMAESGAHAFAAQFGPDGSFDWGRQAVGDTSFLAAATTVEGAALIGCVRDFGVFQDEAGATASFSAGGPDSYATVLVGYTSTGDLSWARDIGAADSCQLHDFVDWDLYAADDGALLVGGSLRKGSPVGQVSLEDPSHALEPVGGDDVFVSKLNSAGGLGCE